MREIKALIDGEWHGQLLQTADVRAALANPDGFRDRVTADGSTEFKAEPGRYHLYASYACPWAHRTLIYRRLKGLEDTISVSILHPRWAGPDGWRFEDDPLSTVDHAGGRRFLHEVYSAARVDFTGRVTVPVLWDRKRQTIVNNESGDIIRMFNSEFDSWGDGSVDFYPLALRGEIDALNSWILRDVCLGVYRAGFAASQDAYDDAIRVLFQALDELEARLSRQPYLLGSRLTESDWHLFATLCRFDAAYVGALKCNLRSLVDYPALSAFTRRLHRIPGVARTVRVDHIKLHYYDAIGIIDPTIVPAGPAVDYLTCPAVGSEEVFRREVFAMHTYLEEWMKGSLPATHAHPQRLCDVLADEFEVVHPNGKRDNKSGVIQNFAAAYGTKKDCYTLEISNLSLRMLSERLCLAQYHESHRGEPGRSRISTALLRQVSGKCVEWLSLQETALV